MKLLHVSFLAGVIILIGTFFGLFGKLLQDKNSSEKSDAILSTGISTKQNVESLHKTITGGDSYCIFEVFFNYKTNKPSFNLRHVGSNSLKNIIITIEDHGRRQFLIQEVAKNDFTSPEIGPIINKTYYSFEYLSLYPNTMIDDIKIPIEPDQNEIKLRINIQLENGPLSELLTVTDIKNRENRIINLELKRGDQILDTQ